MEQLIAFRRNKILVRNNDTNKVLDPSLAKMQLSIGNEMAEAGYIIPTDILLKLTEEDLKEIHNDIVSGWIKENYHTDIPGESFKILYPGFPEQVIDLGKEKLFDIQEGIYNGTKTVEEIINEGLLSYKVGEISKKSTTKKAIILSEMSNKEFMNIPVSLCKAANSLSQTSKDELVWFLTNYPEEELELPERIPFKETLCIVLNYCRQTYDPRDVNDILRFAFWKMGADPSLPKIEKVVSDGWGNKSKQCPRHDLKPLSRSDRRYIMTMLDNICSVKGLKLVIPEAKGKFYGRWMLLAERVHPGDFKNSFPHAITFFSNLLDRKKHKNYRTWGSGIQELYKKGESVATITKVISKRPGELVRRFDSLFRRALSEGERSVSDVFDIFIDTEGMNNKTLLELVSFYNRQKVSDYRSVKVPGKVGRFELPKKTPLKEEYIEMIQYFCFKKINQNIADRTEKDLIGKTILLDEKISNIPVPTNMRESTSQIPAGTRFDIPEDKNFVLMYTQWIQEGRDEDLDLSAYLISEDFKKKCNIGWNTGLVEEDLCAVHSGDVLNTPGNCQESILINLKNSRKAGYRYVVMSVRNYKGRPLNSLPAWHGYEFYSKFGKISKNVLTKNPEYQAKLITGGTTCTSLILDIQERQIIFLDVDVDTLPVFTNGNAEEGLIKLYCAKPAVTTYDILKCWYETRGAKVVNEIVEDDYEVDDTITFDDVVSDYVKVLEVIGE